VVVDTDVAADDARALALLFTVPSIRVIAVVTSDGVSPPDVGATNVCRILRFLKADGVAVGMGRALEKPPPPFRLNATGLDWPQLGEPAIPAAGLERATNLLRRTLRNAPGRVIYVCLGPLTNLAEALEQDPELAEKIEAVIWSGTPADANRPSWNARRDPAAVEKIVATGLRVEAVHWPDDTTAPVFDAGLLDELRGVDSPAARLVVALHGSGRGAELVRAGHLRLWDDLVALRMINGSVIAAKPVRERAFWLEAIPVAADALRDALIAALHPLPARGTVVLADFPTTDPARLLPDVREIAPAIIARHGLEEWKAAVLTSELHRHLGTYSIVGAKMGLRARELLNAALDELRVESRAGLTPPLSCVNDGLQVATGASLGRGTITVLTNAPACEAVFSDNVRRLRLRLKPELASRIATDLAKLANRHAGTTPAYFEDVRRLSLEHWLKFDRRTMFDESLEAGGNTP
jgi:pyrimidine-specific ribonucleoside hydrolase